ncbi:hypothetical protein [Streptomyces sp. BE133]|uniref:hypothetical protein n=1 Tax=Streptomyces sp. BE133 TaxID=3002523 RepID=UPI003FA70184
MNDRADARQEAGHRIHTLLGPDGEPCRGTTPGTLGGHRRGRVIGTGETLRKQTSFDDYLAQRTADPSYTFRQHLRRTGGAIEE